MTVLLLHTLEPWGPGNGIAKENQHQQYRFFIRQSNAINEHPLHSFFIDHLFIIIIIKFGNGKKHAFPKDK